MTDKIMQYPEGLLASSATAEDPESFHQGLNASSAEPAADLSIAEQIVSLERLRLVVRGFSQLTTKGTSPH